MGYKNENLKHAQPLKTFNYKCPYCGDLKQFPKAPFSTICGKCGKYVRGDKLIKL